MDAINWIRVCDKIVGLRQAAAPSISSAIKESRVVVSHDA